LRRRRRTHRAKSERSLARRLSRTGAKVVAPSAGRKEQACRAGGRGGESAKTKMNPYHHFISEYARFAKEGRTYPLGQFAPSPRPATAPNAPKVLIFSPHPDDEVIIGGLALRLLREARWNVVNVAVTQGSKKERQAERFQE